MSESRATCCYSHCHSRRFGSTHHIGTTSRRNCRILKQYGAWPSASMHDPSSTAVGLASSSLLQWRAAEERLMTRLITPMTRAQVYGLLIKTAPGTRRCSVGE